MILYNKTATKDILGKIWTKKRSISIVYTGLKLRTKYKIGCDGTCIPAVFAIQEAERGDLQVWGQLGNLAGICFKI